MCHLPPNGVLACFSQAVSPVQSSRVNARAPANILDARPDLFLASSFATERHAEVKRGLFCPKKAPRRLFCGVLGRFSEFAVLGTRSLERAV